MRPRATCFSLGPAGRQNRTSFRVFHRKEARLFNRHFHAFSVQRAGGTFSTRVNSECRTDLPATAPAKMRQRRFLRRQSRRMHGEKSIFRLCRSGNFRDPRWPRRVRVRLEPDPARGSPGAGRQGRPIPIPRQQGGVNPTAWRCVEG